MLHFRCDVYALSISVLLCPLMSSCVLLCPLMSSARSAVLTMIVQLDQIVTEGREADESKTSGYYEDTRLSMSLQNILSADLDAVRT